jgi:Holliday junction resolvase RusA-like endonuclease
MVGLTFKEFCMSNWIVSFWLPGQPPRKSNSRKVVRIRGQTRVIKSAQARAWVERSLLSIPEEAKLGLGSAQQPLRILFEVFYETRRPDLSVELVLDVLERAGVISNDRHVYEYTARKLFSKELPGVLVHVGYLEVERC